MSDQTGNNIVPLVQPESSRCTFNVEELKRLYPDLEWVEVKISDELVAVDGMMGVADIQQPQTTELARVVRTMRGDDSRVKAEADFNSPARVTRRKRWLHMVMGRSQS